MDDKDSTTGDIIGKIALFGFRTVLLAFLGLISWIGNAAYQKIENAADKVSVASTAAALQADVNRSNTSLWQAIGTTNKVQNDLTANVSSLTATVKAHAERDDDVSKDLKSAVGELRSQLQRQPIATTNERKTR